MLGASEETRYFDSIKDDLLSTSAGRFAVITGRRLIGVYASVDDALGAMADAFTDFDLPEGTSILITEIAESVSIRVVASPARVNSLPAG